jgi:hypothetical protein
VINSVHGNRAVQSSVSPHAHDNHPSHKSSERPVSGGLSSVKRIDNNTNFMMPRHHLTGTIDASTYKNERSSSPFVVEAQVYKPPIPNLVRLDDDHRTPNDRDLGKTRHDIYNENHQYNSAQ